MKRSVAFLIFCWLEEYFEKQIINWNIESGKWWFYLFVVNNYVGNISFSYATYTGSEAKNCWQY